MCAVAAWDTVHTFSTAPNKLSKFYSSGCDTPKIHITGFTTKNPPIVRVHGGCQRGIVLFGEQQNYTLYMPTNLLTIIFIFRREPTANSLIYSLAVCLLRSFSPRRKGTFRPTQTHSDAYGRTRTPSAHPDRGGWLEIAPNCTAPMCAECALQGFPKKTCGTCDRDEHFHCLYRQTHTQMQTKNARRTLFSSPRLEIARRIKVERCDRLAFSNCARTAWQLFTLIPYILKSAESRCEYRARHLPSAHRESPSLRVVTFRVADFFLMRIWGAHCKTA